ncbi:MAG TPA: helix-turn-helix domain-containing protein [Streptosporangiaceae bacterium]
MLATTTPTRTQLTRFRARMAADGFDSAAICSAFVSVFGCRPRLAWRHALGLSQTEVADRYNLLFTASARASMSASRISAYERWPEGGERPGPGVLCSLAELYGVRPADLIDDLDLRKTPEPDRQALRDLLNQQDAERPQPPAEGRREFAYRQTESGPDASDDRAVREVVVMAAHEGSEHAEDAERRDIGDATLEQLRADVVRLSHEHMTGDPFPTFQEMRRVRRRIYAALDRKLWPRDQTELYFLLGVLNGLMGLSAASYLGNRQAAEELVRAAWAYATAIDHRPLMGYLRLELASIVYWQRPRQSRDLARSGIEYLSDGENAAQLYLAFGQAAARIGDTETARRAIVDAHEARARDQHDDLLEIGGEFGLSQATQHYKAGALLVEIPDGTREAIPELQQAVSLYDAGPGPGESHSQSYTFGSRADLATALLRDGQLDAATDALGPVLALPPGRRGDSLLRRLDRVRGELAAARYRGQPQADDLDENIETFRSETIVGDLAELPGAG